MRGISWSIEAHMTNSTRAAAIIAATAHFDDGGFRNDLARRIAIPTESQNPDSGAALSRKK
jgi:hypothetical protein